MADIDLTEEDADALLAMAKHKADDAVYEHPSLGGGNAAGAPEGRIGAAETAGVGGATASFRAGDVGVSCEMVGFWR